MTRFLIVIVLLAAVGGGAWWWAQKSPEREHEHALEVQTDAAGEVYYSCPMHPQVRQDEPGNCPICGMKLVRREAEPSPAKAGTRKEKDVLYWYDPMKPEVHFDQPGKSPFMDMQLVPKYADAGGEGGVVEIDPRVVQNLGIRTAKVERGTFSQRVDAVGAVELNERRIVAVASRASGWVEKLSVRAVGDPVRRGQFIAGVYSPELYAAQEELVLAARTGDAALIGATRQRLSLLGVPASQIESVLRNRKAQRQTVIAAPADGIVTELNVLEGGQVMPGQPLMRLADLSEIWISVEIPETQGAWIAPGHEAEARLSALPEKVFTGKVDYLYPRLDAATRTLRARIVLDNPELALKPGMFAEVTLFGGPRADVLLIPSEAVIRTGERSVVILAEGDGSRFRPAVVKPGAERQGQTEILSGLAEGETIVVSGQFLIDSEANLRGALARVMGEAAAEGAEPIGELGAPAAPDDHGDAQ